MVSDQTTERRSILRFRGDTIGTVHVQAEPTAAPVPARVADLSVQGIGVVVPSSFTPGTCLSLLVGPSLKSLTTEVTAQVKHATLRPDGRWFLGCAFSRMLTIDDVMALG